MNTTLIFIGFVVLIITPLAFAVNWFKYKNSIVLKNAIAVMAAVFIISISSYMVGKFGLIHLIWFFPLGYFALLLGNFIFKKFAQKPINYLIDVIKKVSLGNLDIEIEDKLKNQKDEIGEIGTTVETLIANYKVTSEIAGKIGEGKLDNQISLLSDDDVMRKSLTEMQLKLKEASKLEDERRREDDKRTWINEGLAKFAETLRQFDKIEELSFQIINDLVNYLGVNQGGIFIKTEDENDNAIFRLTASVAFNRRKFLEREIALGEGLVGTCAIEAQTIYLLDLPQDYIEITSGLGDANPTNLLLVPLKIEEDVLGVIELASFEKIEKYQVDFVERLSHNIASTLRTVDINQRTAELLERTQQQAEEMAAQEEEMRQNMEELQATQEESARKSEEMGGLLNALNNSSYVAEYDTQGYLLEINESYLNLIGKPRSEIIGTHHSMQMVFTEEQQRRYDEFWKDLLKGKIRRERNTVEIEGRKLQLLESYTPIKNYDGEVIKILKIGNDLNEFKE